MSESAEGKVVGKGFGEWEWGGVRIDPLVDLTKQQELAMVHFEEIHVLK